MRCEWSVNNERMQHYHDTEWGVPVHDDRLLFEHLTLDGFQAGLSWQTILNKRENFRMAFDNFDINKVASYDVSKIESLLQDKGIIRNRLKIEAAVNNANRVLEIQNRGESFDSFIWSFTEGKTLMNAFESISELPANSPISDALSKTMKKMGFKFVGSTIIYAFMQAIGMVNDHVVSCFRYYELASK